MTGISPAFREALVTVLDRLGRALGRAPFEPVLDDTAHRARVDGDHVRVPVRYEVHWQRFGAFPTDLAREAAFDAMRQTMRDAFDEVECQTFAEVFVRDHVLNAD